MILDVESATPMVLNKKNLTIFRLYELLLINIEKMNHGNISVEVYLCKPVTNIWFQGYTHSMSPGWEQF